MNTKQLKNLLQLIGLAMVSFGIYAGWSEYQQMTGFAYALLGSGNEVRSMFDGLINSMNMGLPDLIAKQPWVWIGAALILAPYLIGLSKPPTSMPKPISEPIQDFFVECPKCKGAMRESASFCPHCGASK